MNIWDKRYSEAELAYGAEPNDYLVAVADQLPPGRALCLADGEGRNGVFMAQRGYDVLSVDLSSVGLASAQRLAAARGVAIATEVADLTVRDLEPAAWDVIVSIWCHLPSVARRRLHRQIAGALRPGGAFVLEAYSPEQLGRGTGGPPDVDRLMPLAELREDLSGLDLVIARAVERDIQEGRYHHGASSVVQILGFKRG